MRVGRRLPLLGLALMLLAGCGDSGPAPEAPAAAATSAQTVYSPSPFARETLDERSLRAYQRVGESLGLDWTIVGAIDQIESPGGVDDPVQRAQAIAYALQAMGAPSDYEIAIEARAGGDFAPRVLALAERYRGRSSAQLGSVPNESTPLSVPVEGEAVAPFGRGYGLLHDGVDIDAETGDPIRAIGSGTAVSVGFTQAYGNRTCLLHRLVPPFRGTSRITSCYGNQSAFEVETGETVERDAVIGRVGCSGPCLRPHTHFQILLGSGPDGEAIDPLPFLGGALQVGSGGSDLEGGG